MEGFKIKYKIKEFNIPRMKSFYGEDREDVTYIRNTAYAPIYSGGTKGVITGYKVYSYRPSGYWMFVDKITAQEYENINVLESWKK